MFSRLVIVSRKHRSGVSDQGPRPLLRQAHDRACGFDLVVGRPHGAHRREEGAAALGARDRAWCRHGRVGCGEAARRLQRQGAQDRARGGLSGDASCVLNFGRASGAPPPPDLVVAVRVRFFRADPHLLGHDRHRGESLSLQTQKKFFNSVAKLTHSCSFRFAVQLPQQVDGTLVLDKTLCTPFPSPSSFSLFLHTCQR